MLLADATIHAFNWKRENWTIPETEFSLAPAAGFHQFLTPDDKSRLTADQWLIDWTPDQIEQIIIRETPLDLIAYHGTPIFDFFKDGHSATEKGYVLKERHPNRVLVYGAANPFEGEKALRDIEEHAERGANAIKVYAARWEKGKTYGQPLDDPEFGYPFIQKALDCGIDIIATHKTMPFGPSHPGPYGMDDIPEVCGVFPQMKFEIVHAGFAWVEETTFLANLPNCWFNLEGSQGLIHPAPRRFADFLGRFLMVGAEDRIVFSTGCPLAHPAPMIQRFLDFEMPQDMVEGLGYPEFTDEIKRKVLGENFFRMHGIDTEEFKKKTAGDEWDRQREDGLDDTWDNLRAELSQPVA